MDGNRMDGVTHINIYSKGKTSLGQSLSNFADTPINTVDGYFQSIEGYWYWLNTDDRPGRDVLRFEHGYSAKELGRQMAADDWCDDPSFKLRIYAAMLTKLIQHDNILQEFRNNKLPFRHYYTYKSKIVEPKEGKWILDMWTFIQEQLCGPLTSIQLQ
jgi:hypothetical protein